jgi:hypothetical protein
MQMTHNTNTQVRGNKGIEILPPTLNYNGKSYSELTCDWFNWFLSAHADKRNSGRVVFLRSHGLPNKDTGAYTSDLPSEIIDKGTSALEDDHTGDLDYYPTTYVNDPNIRIDGHKLQIYLDQAIFVPIIVSYKLASTAYMDWGFLQDYTGLLIDNGDNPPHEYQLGIYSKDDIKRSLFVPNIPMTSFRVTTPTFPAVVPDAPYGTSIKDFLEERSVAPGTYQAMVDGYFVMFRFTAPGSYLIHAWASAGREPRGPYFSELLYEIEVLPQRAEHGMITPVIPARNNEIVNRILKAKASEQDGLPDVIANQQRDLIEDIIDIRNKAKEHVESERKKKKP